MSAPASFQENPQLIHPLLYRAAIAACFVVGLLPHATLAQPTASGFTFCTVTDMSGGGMGTAKVWASPVFEFTHRADDHIGLQRSQELASEFHRFVGTLGGAGDKSCAIGSTAAELETLRAEQRAMWTKRVMLWASKWQDVAWTPAPWDPATAPPKPAIMTKYFYCYSIDPDVRRSVASEVFSKPVLGDDPLAPYNQSEAYAREFGPVAIAQGVPDGGPLCVFHDTLAEAEKSRQELRRPFSDFTQRFIDLRWTPTATAVAAAPVQAIQQPTEQPQPAPAEPQTAAAPGRIGLKLDAVTPGLATGLGLPQPQGALVVAVVAGSGAERAGLRPLDVILEIAGQPVQTPADLQTVASRMRPGYSAPLRVWRERAALELAVELTAATAPTTAAPNAAR